jgi:hypothetical protein
LIRTDKVFAWMLLVMASIHMVIGFVVLSRTVDAAKVETTVWFLGGGSSMLLAAFLNLVRIARPADRLVRRLSAIGNFLQIVLSGLVIWMVGHEIKKNPQVIVVTAVVVAEFLFSLRPPLGK